MAVYFLDDLLRAISDAVSASNRAMEDAYLEHQARHFESKDGSRGLEPTMRTLMLPREHVSAGEPVVAPTEVPESVLTHHNQVVLDTLKVEIDCLVAGLGRAKKQDADTPSRVALLLGGSIPPESNPARLTIQFKTLDPTEGTARVNDKLLKTF